ncbi:MAG TPA: hypothetical protein V6D08_08725 [Candidatus Obscuribacterales bacterium]
MKTEAEIRLALRQWVLKNSNKISAEDLGDDTAIIEQRIITSLQIMDLILFIETLTNCPIEVDSLKPGTFRNLNTIYKGFFHGDDDDRSAKES